MIEEPCRLVDQDCGTCEEICHNASGSDSPEFNGLCCDGCKWLWPSEAEQNEMKEYIDHACRKYGARVYHYGQHPRLPRLKYCKQP